MKWNRLYKESMDADMELRDIIKKDPTGFALAIRTLITRLLENDAERALYYAIDGIRNSEIQKALFQIKREEWDRLINDED